MSIPKKEDPRTIRSREMSFCSSVLYFAHVRGILACC
jgi:hypothetical protein